MRTSLDAKIRPLGQNTGLEKASLMGAARIYVSRDSHIALTGTLDYGRRCSVDLLDAASSAVVESRREALLWLLPDKNLSPNVVMMTRAFMEATNLKVGDQVRISLGPAEAEAEQVVLQDVSEAEQRDAAADEARYQPSWEYILSLCMKRAEQIFPGMVFEGVNMSTDRRRFRVLSVNSQTRNLARFKISSTEIRILAQGEKEESEVSDMLLRDLVVSNAPGLASQVKTLNRFFAAYSFPYLLRGERKSCGIVIHGDHGTGKTFVLRRIAETGWGKVYWIKPSDKLLSIRDVFKQAHASERSIILIDDIDELISKDRSNREAVIEALCDELDNLSAKAQLLNALPRVVVVATSLDYFTRVPLKLQNENRFDKSILLSTPRAEQRLEILTHLDPPLRSEEKQECLASIAQNTHAYNSRDLVKLVSAAIDIMRTRIEESADSDCTPSLTVLDIQQAQRVIRPTAMHDINLNPPTIHWQDIGGQEALKKILSKMIRHAKNTNLISSKVVRNPPKGLLLYGPPGCSKTLSAQAMATESGFNFFAVKGAELLNMYVGETERAVRNLFGRARAASPSIIFFDEIDSIGGQRGASGTESRSLSAVNTITTLLTEMDGFEPLTGVLVLAATNRPEAIDAALLRPGRFDQVVYVGPPTQQAREAIFAVHLRGLTTAPDVDVLRLAVLAHGSSGAEIEAIVKSAGQAALERFEELRHDCERDTDEPCISMADLEAAVKRSPCKITRQMVEGYERWTEQFQR
ncbi:hypothetical protein CDD82_7925 [Ophiocordyceps australis]|uniref:AAA+ ATPase domain-containing protein n=1 Tax=Ophiocordyceps australis TaxID=1399860 RepID=A0A2C5ZIG1_9HYPO|nr:hypothetical protein CDD82_7925 [Ophiocordyceps australis]